MKLLAIVTAFLLPTSLAIKCSEIVRKPQTQPPTYVSSTVQADLAKYESHEKAQLDLNGQVQPVCEEARRFATYNIHQHKDMYGGKDNTANIKSDLEKFTPTVIVFQEVDSDATKRKPFTDMLESLGYKDREFDSSAGATFGNMIASKLPMKRIGQQDLEGKRSILAVVVGEDEDAIAVLGMHLDASVVDMRKRQAEQIMDFIEQQIAPEYKRYLLAGDMNDTTDSTTVKVLTADDKIKESFVSLDVTSPSYTSWVGKAVDHILASSVLAKQLLGTYVYHTISSDHLPVMVDIISVNQLPSSRWSWWSIGGVILIVLILAAIIAFFAFRRP